MYLRYLIVFLISGLTFSQDISRGIVYYGQFENMLSGKRRGNDRLSTLIFNKTESNYVTFKDSLDSIPKDNIKSIVKVESGTYTMYGGGGKMAPVSNRGDQVYTNLIKDSVWSCFQRVTFHFVKEKRKKIDWKLFNETKKIGAFNCQKATATFRGRDYTAWYTNEIPLPFGPWKLQGLPGLIIEAYDTSEEIYYYAKQIEYPTQNPTPIYKVKLDKNEKWLNYPDYLKRLEEIIKSRDERAALLEMNIMKTTAKDEFKEISE